MSKKRIILSVIAVALTVAMALSVSASGIETSVEYIEDIPEEVRELSMVEINPSITEAVVTEFDNQNNAISPRNVDYQKYNYTTAMGASHTVNFDLNGSWGGQGHNKVSFVISNISWGDYAIALKDNTTNQVLFSGEKHYGDYGFDLLSGVPGHSYTFILTNLAMHALTYDITIISYI